MQQESVFQGTIILFLSGVINKIIGFVLRIIIARTIGDQSLGLFQMIYPLFITFLIISSMGFPLAISKLIPEKIASGKFYKSTQMLKITLIFSGLMGLLMTIILFIFGNTFARVFFHNPEVYQSLIGLAPAVLICSLASGFKGYFQGMQTMKPTALARTTEQINRFLATIILINMLGNLGVSYGAMAISLGITIGEFTGLLLLLFIFFSFPTQTKKTPPDKNPGDYLKSFKEMGQIAFPVSLANLINSLMLSLKAILIPRGLIKSGLSTDKTASLYGQFSGMAFQVIFLPSVITSSLTTSLIPRISRAYANNNLKKIRELYQDIIRITTYLGFPLTAIFITSGTEICYFLYSFPEAGKLLSGLAVTTTFIYYLQLSTGILNALGKPILALINGTSGSIIQTGGIYLLVSNPLFRLQGAIISIIAGVILSSILNYISLKKIIDFQLDFQQTIFKPLFSSISLYCFIFLLKRSLIFPFPLIESSKLNILILMFLSVAFYTLIMILLKAFTIKDLKKIKLK